MCECIAALGIHIHSYSLPRVEASHWVGPHIRLRPNTAFEEQKPVEAAQKEKEGNTLFIDSVLLSTPPRALINLTMKYDKATQVARKCKIVLGTPSAPRWSFILISPTAPPWLPVSALAAPVLCVGGEAARAFGAVSGPLLRTSCL